MDWDEVHKAIKRATTTEGELMGRSPRIKPPLSGDPEFEKVIQEVLEMHRRKGADYGNDQDFFANVSQSALWGIEPWVGAMLRLNDKVIRLQQAATRGSLANEGVEDSMLDIATYAIIALCLFRREGNSDRRE